MCLANQTDSRKALWFKKLGSLSLAIGLLLQIFAHPTGDTTRIWLHATIGFLLGFAIMALLAGVRFSRPRA